MKQKLAEFINVLFGLRKFIAWVAVFLIGVVFRVASLIDGAEFVDLTKNTFLAFVAANGAEHLLTVVKQYVGSKAPAVTAVIDALPPSDNIVPPKEK